MFMGEGSGVIDIFQNCNWVDVEPFSNRNDPLGPECAFGINVDNFAVSASCASCARSSSEFE